ncbi:MAG: SDR family oxidoreductase [Planctomycetia bacterium]|nr:SDR family oxidoreductase [Planctomycetia bacterium]
MNSECFAYLAGMKAVVTGSTSGIGRAIASELSRAGADVVIHGCHNYGAANDLAVQFQTNGKRACVVMADLSREENLHVFVEQCWSEFNGIDIWINNAGVDLLTGEEAKLPFSQKLQRLYEVDVRATLLLSRLSGAKMSASSGGVILNIGWDQADRGMEGDSGELFAASKNAIMGFTRSLSLSLAPSVRVNCIAPGWIRTKWGKGASSAWQERVLRETPLQRWGTPEDIAVMARFLVSREANYITGQIFNVNGGAER